MMPIFIESQHQITRGGLMNNDTITVSTGGHTPMIAILSKIKMNARQVLGAVIFVILSSVAQMLAPALVSTMLNEHFGSLASGHITHYDVDIGE